MKYFDISFTPKKDFKRYRRFINFPFLVLLLCSFLIFSVYSTIAGLLFSDNKSDIFSQDLQELAIYFRPIDTNFSSFLLTLDSVVQDYIDGENVFKTRKDEIEDVWLYIFENREYLTALWFDEYDSLMDFIADIWKYKDTVFALLWEDQIYNYLVILQNSNEKRPNGWFFGSFAFISIEHGFIKELEIIDAYFPNFIANRTFIPAPSWTNSIRDDDRIGFIAWNKFGFTDIDGNNLKVLYEKIFNEDYDPNKLAATFRPEVSNILINRYIKWVIFIETDLLESLLPRFEEKVWEWQFVNASINLIRWEYRGNKKELYIEEITDFFNQNKWTIARNFINNFEKILDERFVNIHLSNVPGELYGLLQKWQLTNTYDENYLYAWDTNNSFGKVDGFVEKSSIITDQNNRLVVYNDRDIIPLAGLTSNTQYTLTISYALNVPSYYRNFIWWLETKYGISITDRERWILALQPGQYTPESRKERWNPKSMLFFPPWTEILWVQWDAIDIRYFFPPFAQWLYYEMLNNTNNTIQSITIDFILPSSND